MTNFLEQKPFYYLCGALLLRAGFLLLLMAWGPFSLTPDEAQYWTWSEDLSFGYYSKPPGIAWQIAMTTFLFGSNEVGVRLGALIWGTLLSLILYFLGVSSGLSRKQSAWTAGLFSVAPMGMFGSFLAITDTGMLVFWTLACWLIVRGYQNERFPRAIFLGLCFLFGALFKWPMYLLVLVVLVMFWWQKSARSAVVFSLLALFPMLFWNLSHDFATFRHVWAAVLSEGSAHTTAGSQGNLPEFVGAQALLMSPVWFIFFIVAWFNSLTSYSEGKARFIIAVSSLILIPLTMAFFTKVQGNWGDFAYPTATVLTALYVFSKPWGEKAFTWSITLACVITASALLVAPVLPLSKNPFKHLLGWRNLTPALVEKGYSPHQDILIADSYQMTSLLSFYAPKQPLAYFLNLQGKRRNQFSYTSQLEKGMSGLFVAAEEKPHLKGGETAWIAQKKDLLAPYFESVEYIGQYPLWQKGEKVERQAFFFRVNSFKGQFPPESTLF